MKVVVLICYLLPPDPIQSRREHGHGDGRPRHHRHVQRSWRGQEGVPIGTPLQQEATIGSANHAWGRARPGQPSPSRCAPKAGTATGVGEVIHRSELRQRVCRSTRWQRPLLRQFIQCVRRRALHEVWWGDITEHGVDGSSVWWSQWVKPAVCSILVTNSQEVSGALWVSKYAVFSLRHH